MSTIATNSTRIQAPPFSGERGDVERYTQNVTEWERSCSTPVPQRVAELLLKAPIEIRDMVYNLGNENRFKAKKWSERIPRDQVKSVCESLQDKQQVAFDEMLEREKDTVDWIRSELVAKKIRGLPKQEGSGSPKPPAKVPDLSLIHI